mgnify:CR=1 FL=1
MDMDFVHHADLTEKGNPYRERAYRILNGVKYGEFVDPEAVSYTHLTLPTICSV